MSFINAFWVGGLLCAIGQIFIDKTSLTPARIMVGFVCAGALFGALGLYEPIVKYAGAGATVPISGFGYSLSKGVIEAVQKQGVIGIFTGGITATSAGIAAAMAFGFLFALIGKPKEK